MEESQLYQTPETVKQAFDSSIMSGSMKRLSDDAASTLATNLNELIERSSWERHLASIPEIIVQDRNLRASPIRKTAEKLVRLLTDQLESICNTPHIFGPLTKEEAIRKYVPLLAEDSQLRRLIRLHRSMYYKWTAWQEDVANLERWYREAVSQTNPTITFGTKGHLARFICWAVQVVHDRRITVEDADVALREMRSGKCRKRRSFPEKNA